MEAKDYLIKVNKICNDFEKGAGCNMCPLRQYGCGIAREEKEIETVLDITEKYEEKTYPFGHCRSCNKEFNSELINEYGIKNCPWCGEKINS